MHCSVYKSPDVGFGSKLMGPFLGPVGAIKWQGCIWVSFFSIGLVRIIVFKFELYLTKLKQRWS